MPYAHKKAIWGCEIATFRTKTFHFFRIIRLNWLAITDLTGGPGPLVFHIVVSYCCKRKMLKRNWRNFKLFWHIFVIGEILIEGGSVLVSLPSPLATLMLQLRKKKCLQIFRNVSGVFQQNFNGSKNSAVLEPRTGQFSRTWGFKDLTFEAKDLTFEANTKDFKMYPRGIHLCSTVDSWFRLLSRDTVWNRLYWRNENYLW